MNDDNLHREAINFFKRGFQKTWKLIVGFVVVIILVLAAVALFTPGGVTFYNKCNEAKEINEMKFYGVVRSKKNPNAQHGLHFLTIQSPNSKEVLILMHDRVVHRETRRSFFWEVVSEGDSVRKEQDTFEVGYKKAGGQWKSHTLGFKLCDD
ncbi:MAG: hypothetical protein ACQETL_09695 [Bacteroidota bacterium]